MLLFDKNFICINSEEELDRISKGYPEYDRAYLEVSAGKPYKDIKEQLEKYWEIYKPYADPNFKEKVKQEFIQCTWEMYLACTFLDNGFTLQKKERARGPDICLIVDNKKIWIEATVPTVGTSDDKVNFSDRPDKIFKLHNYEEEKILLRLTNALSNKYGKYKKYLEDGIINSEEPYIIAINAVKVGAMSIEKSGCTSLIAPANVAKAFQAASTLPLILKCLYCIGVPVITNNKLVFKRRETIPKRSGSEISQDFFENSEYSGISAVLYCEDDILNSPYSNKGSNFVMALNQMAKNKINHELFNFCDRWIKDENNSTPCETQLICIKRGQNA